MLALDAPDLQKTIREIPAKVFALALRGLDAGAKTALFKKIPERQGRAIEEEILTLGPQKLSDVKRAREKLVETALDLHQKNEIKLK